MSTPTASRADRLIEGAEAGALVHAKNLDGGEDVAMAYQITLLEQIVRGLVDKLDTARASAANLTNELARLRAASRAQGERIQQLTFDAAKGDDDFDALSDDLQRRIAAFNRSTGAAAALRGEL